MSLARAPKSPDLERGLSPVGLRWLAAFREGIQRDQTQTVSEWAEEFRVLSIVGAAESGRWRNERTPYLRDIMDELSPDGLFHRVVFMKAAQVGGTECGNNWIGYCVHRTPGPILYVEPTLDVVKRVSRQRITPMFEATPALAGLVAPARSRDSGNTVQIKTFKNGVLLMTGANSAAGLRSMPIRFLFMDEIDEYPPDVGGQGDPVLLAEKRTATFPNRKLFLTSTPTLRGWSRIEKEFQRSDQRRYFIPCPECGAMDWLQWSPGGWRGEEGRHHSIAWEGRDPTTAGMACSSCGAISGEAKKAEMLARGEWRPTSSGDGKTAGFHLSALYSPPGWKSWAQCVAEFFQAKDDPWKLKTWVNTVLAETWEEKGDSVESHVLKSRLEQYAAEVPSGVGVLVAAADVQSDRIEAQVVGYGAGEESWLIAFEQLLGDPATAKPWDELDRFLGQSFTHESGAKLQVRKCAVDTGGLHTEQAYRYCAARGSRGVIAVKGGTISGRPLVERPSLRNRYKVPLFILCVDTGKDILMGRLQSERPGAGYVHLPEWVDDEYLEQLTSERALRRYVKGRGAVRVWEKVKTRNEALDLTVYSLAALYVCGAAFLKSLPDLALEAARPPEAPQESPKPGPRFPRRGGWMSGLR